MSPALIICIVACVCLVLCGIPLCIGLLLPAVSKIRGSANAMQSANNMKQIALAVQNYDDTNDELPNNSYDKDGKPLLSWRVHILPYIEQDNLYKQFKLDEPWDGPNNSRLLDQMPKIFRNPNEPGMISRTYYRGFSSKGAIFEKRPSRILQGEGAPLPRKDETLNLGKIKDLHGETILIVDAGDPIEWTKPDDLDASPGKPFPRLGGMKLRPDRFQVATVDGNVKMLRTDLPETTLRALVTYNGGEVLPPNWDD